MKPDTETLGAIVRLIVGAVNPRRIILFGSAVRETMTLDSDFDVLVVMPDGSPRLRTAQIIYRKMIGFHHDVDVVVATESDLITHGDNAGLVYHAALTEGRTVYAA